MNGNKVDWRAVDRLWDTVARPGMAVMESVADEVKFVSYNFNNRKRFPKPLASVELMHLTDAQYGSKLFRKDRFIEYRDWMLAEPNRFAVLGGDMIDAATVLSVQSPYENTEEPIDQVAGLVSLLDPLAKAGRLLGYVGGNHERRTIKAFGDCGRLIASQLKVPYSRGVQLLDIHYGKHRPFKVSVWHGAGSAQTKGAKAQMVHRFMRQADSQVYLVGHLHDVVLLFDWRQLRTGKRITLQKIAGIMSSSFQSYWNSYGEIKALPPSDTMMARIILEPGGGWEVTLR